MSAVACMPGTLTQVYWARLHPGTDLIDGIAGVCRENGISAASITTGIGSLRGASFYVAVPKAGKSGGGYSEPISVQGPAELLSCQGTVGSDGEGGLFIHLHGVISDSSGRLHGGHLIKGSCPVLITCEILIAAFAGLQPVLRHDPAVEMKVLIPANRPV